MRENVSRRQVLLGTGTLAATGISSIALASQETTATTQLEASTFEIEDVKAVLADTQLEDIRLSADFGLTVESNARIHGLEADLRVGATTDTASIIAKYENHELGTTGTTVEDSMSGSILNADDYSVDAFTPTSGEISRSVVAVLDARAYRDDEEVATSRAVGSFTVTVSEESLEVSLGVDASGEVAVETT